MMPVRRASNGKASTQQIKSMLRFQTGKWFTAPCADALTEGGLQVVCMVGVRCQPESTTQWILELLAGRLVPLFCSYGVKKISYLDHRRAEGTRCISWILTA